MAEEQIQRQSFFHAMPDPTVPNVDSHRSESESSLNFYDGDDPQFLEIIEREIYELTVKEAEMEGLKKAAYRDNDGQEERVERYDLGGENGAGIVDDEVQNEENKRWFFGDLGRQRNDGRWWTKYPIRPAAEDCSFYMKTGSCKYGPSCKFNHPPRRNNLAAKERMTWREESSGGSLAPGDCKFYLTSGGCKFGQDCKFSHSSDKNMTSQIPELNVLRLPIRPGEKECPHYMRTGSCKYGSTCKFHHPNPTSVPEGIDIPSSSSSWSLPRAIKEASTYIPSISPPNQSSTASSPKWNGYQAGTYQTSEGGLPIPPAFSVVAKLPINFGAQNRHNSLVDGYPERPGEPECNHFVRTGYCKFNSSCKFHHPKSRSPHSKAGFFALNDKGLPLRPDQPICSFYHRYSICKYGPSCKYDHPSSYSPMPPPF